MSKRRADKSFSSDFRKFFVRGLAILLPSLVTLALFLWAFNFLRANIAAPINLAVREGYLWVAPRTIYKGRVPDELPDWYVVTADEIEEAARTSGRRLVEGDDAARDRLRTRVRERDFKDFWSSQWYLEGIGFVVAIILVYLAGVLVGNYLGRRLYLRAEAALIRIPVIKQVYPNVKQIVDFLIGSESGSKLPSSNRVVLVEYPRKGIWTVGLMTGSTMKSIESVVGEESVTVFIPSSPTPFTGYTITVPAREAYELKISFDEAIRFVVSGGVLIPPREEPDVARQPTGRSPGLSLDEGASSGVEPGQKA